MSVQVKFKKVNENAILPKKATPGSAGYDLYAAESTNIPGVGKGFPGRVDGIIICTALVSTGLQAEIPEGYEIQIRPRSGLAIKSKVTVINSPGTCDADFRGTINVALVNLSTHNFEVNIGDRIAQMVVCKLPDVELVEVDTLSETERGEGGFGSTGIK
jgi:dUTP pyrophosphatase